MNEQIKRKWIKALRSGKYMQTIVGMYEYHGSYCCLGVLGCLVKADLDCWRFSDITIRTGLDIAAIENLADLNDSGATFEQIALCIENGL